MIYIHHIIFCHASYITPRMTRAVVCRLHVIAHRVSSNIMRNRSRAFTQVRVGCEDFKVTPHTSYLTPNSFLSWRLLSTSSVHNRSRDLNSLAHSLCHRTSRVTLQASHALLLMRARAIMKSVLCAWRHMQRRSTRAHIWRESCIVRIKKSCFARWREFFSRQFFRSCLFFFLYVYKICAGARMLMRWSQ